MTLKACRDFDRKLGQQQAQLQKPNGQWEWQKWDMGKPWGRISKEVSQERRRERVFSVTFYFFSKDVKNFRQAIIPIIYANLTWQHKVLSKRRGLQSKSVRRREAKESLSQICSLHKSQQLELTSAVEQGMSLKAHLFPDLQWRLVSSFFPPNKEKRVDGNITLKQTPCLSKRDRGMIAGPWLGETEQ